MLVWESLLAPQHLTLITVISWTSLLLRPLSACFLYVMGHTWRASLTVSFLGHSLPYHWLLPCVLSFGVPGGSQYQWSNMDFRLLLTCLQEKKQGKQNKNPTGQHLHFFSFILQLLTKSKASTKTLTHMEIPPLHLQCPSGLLPQIQQIPYYPSQWLGYLYYLLISLLPVSHTWGT